MGSLRIVNKLFEILKSIENKKLNQIHKISDFNKINLMRLHSKGDLVDCELIHLAFFGHKNRRVHCYTTDKEQGIRNRLKIYCSTINFLIWFFFDYPKVEGAPLHPIVKNDPRPRWKPGKVFILDEKTGKEIKQISITRIYLFCLIYQICLQYFYLFRRWKYKIFK